MYVYEYDANSVVDTGDSFTVMHHTFRSLVIVVTIYIYISVYCMRILCILSFTIMAVYVMLMLYADSGAYVSFFVR